MKLQKHFHLFYIFPVKIGIVIKIVQTKSLKNTIKHHILSLNNLDDLSFDKN
jgi:hypothetical protein